MTNILMKLFIQMVNCLIKNIPEVFEKVGAIGLWGNGFPEPKFDGKFDN